MNPWDIALSSITRNRMSDEKLKGLAAGFVYGFSPFDPQPAYVTWSVMT